MVSLSVIMGIVPQQKPFTHEVTASVTNNFHYCGETMSPAGAAGTVVSPLWGYI